MYMVLHFPSFHCFPHTMRFMLTITHIYERGMKAISWILVKNVHTLHDHKHNTDIIISAC